MPEALTGPVLESAREHGIDMMSGVDVTAVKKIYDRYRVSTSEHGDFRAAYVLAAVGRVPAIEELNLKAAGIRYDRSGIITDEYMHTSADRIFAAGDCVSSKMLDPVADMEAAAAAGTIIKDSSRPVDYSSVPSVVFTYPQMASVGLTAEQAEAEGYSPVVKNGSGSGWPNYRRINAGHVWFETVSDADSGRLLGAHITSPYAGELINIFSYAISSGLKASSFGRVPWTYPAYTSDIKYIV